MKITKDVLLVVFVLVGCISYLQIIKLLINAKDDMAVMLGFLLIVLIPITLLVKTYNHFKSKIKDEKIK